MPQPYKSNNVFQRPGDPNIYLKVMNEWYCYNPQDGLIGSGAMGDVYLGYRRNGARVAIKKVKDCFANNKLIRERARQEASLAFRHPNLVEMVGCCEYAPDFGPIFIVSHFVQGMNVDKYVHQLDGSPNRVEKICRIVCSVLDALSYVHSRGVIHRDIKPSNIMIENGDNVRLMDLGISRMSGGNKFSSCGFIGTPQYSAPEQIKREENGTSTVINASTDIYELGITFYELLTANNPMECESQAETLAKQIAAPLPYDEKIPRRLYQVILKATHKEQSQRYQSADEFKQAIEQSLLPQPTWNEKVGEWLQSHLIVIIVSIICTLTLLAVITFLILSQ